LRATISQVPGYRPVRVPSSIIEKPRSASIDFPELRATPSSSARNAASMSASGSTVVVSPALWARCTAWRRLRLLRPCMLKPATSTTTSWPIGTAHSARWSAVRRRHSTAARGEAASTTGRHPRVRHRRTNASMTSG